MSREILLIEPNYRNKYPPIGLMKIAAYHKKIGDNVTFYKGNIKEFIISQISEECIAKMKAIDNSKAWALQKKNISAFIKRKAIPLRREILQDVEGNEALLDHSLTHYSDYYREKKYVAEPQWDRIYVTTLFTFYWKITVETIKEVKPLVKNIKELRVGGVMASLLSKEIEAETGIIPFKGLLDKAGMLDDNDLIVDEMPLDYSILDEIEYRYPAENSFITFMTKGCTRKCAFCSVPKLEPIYKPKVPTLGKFKVIKDSYGDQQHLLLMDNNALASPKFPEIIGEIKKMGFTKGATYVSPNQLQIAIRNLKKNHNNRAYVRRAYRLIHEFLNKRLKRAGTTAQNFYDTLEKYKLLKLEITTKENLLEAYPFISDTYERLRNKSPKRRYVDFNQGTDARYVTDALMELMSQIPIRPLRIAFDYIGMQKQYVKAVELAAKHGVKELSNYLLYNFVDKPEDLYNRIAINIELSEKLKLHIYSFPMKYIPLFGEEAKHRNYVGKHWNKKYIRAIQSILNVTKGIVAEGRSFFERAFGKNLDEYLEILYMPEAYIIYRGVFEDLGYTKKWKRLFSSLSEEEKSEAKAIITSNDFKSINQKTKNQKICQLLRHYTITRNEVEQEDSDHKRLKTKYDKLIKEDMFIDLTLTHDHEGPATQNREPHYSSRT